MKKILIPMIYIIALMLADGAALGRINYIAGFIGCILLQAAVWRLIKKC